MEHPLLIQARDALARQAFGVARQLFDGVVRDCPQLLEARVGLARCAMSLGQPELASKQLEFAVSLAPDNAEIARSLGVALLALGADQSAQRELERALSLDPALALARLYLGQAMERQGETLKAAQQYFRALVQAQEKGKWLDPQSTAPAMRAMVLHAMDAVDRERRRLLESVLAPHVDRFGVEALARVKQCLEAHLKTLRLEPSDPRQRPRFLFFPDLPSQPFYARDLFPWIGSAELAWTEVRTEVQQVLSAPGALKPFLHFESATQVSDYLGGGETRAWDAFFFYRNGERFDANHHRCPHTSALLESLPLVRIREHAPEICFSVLAPNTHILRHTGVTNIRLVAHLPLLVPLDCAIDVGGQIHAWREGEVVVFDDTFEHEAWNRSDATRVILLMDTWNPYLSDIERGALVDLIGGIGDFNRA